MNTRAPRATTRGFDSAHFRHALSQFATGVTVITTRLADGSFRGLTASSFNSVSLEPPLVLWSLGAGANSLPIFSGNSHYVINVLAAGQQDLALRFTRRTTTDPFERVDNEL
jgi:flavin reductase (DIM6/NTAB) family NADH-FMN oxidoreductase RutF